MKNGVYLALKENHALIIVINNGENYLIDWISTGPRKRILTKIPSGLKIATVSELVKIEDVLFRYEQFKNKEHENCSTFASTLIYGFPFLPSSIYTALLFRQEFGLTPMEYFTLTVRSIFSRLSVSISKKLSFKVLKLNTAR